ncbi:MAG: hypothetical protein ABI837_10275 [Acidobacteriota bacterium]
MPEHLHYDDDAIVNPETHHEESDVNVRPLIIFVVIFIIFAVVTFIGLWILFNTFRSITDKPNAPLTQMQIPPDANIPAEPRLQPFKNKDAAGVVRTPNSNTPVTDMLEMRAREEQVLQHYGWVDQPKGIVHIPIEEAKLRVLRSGFPVVAPPPVTQAAPVVATATGVAPAAPSQPQQGMSSTAPAGSPRP